MRLRTKVRVAGAVGFGVTGAIFGMTTGVAVGGAASDGRWVFGILGALIGWIGVPVVLDLVALLFARKDKA